MHSGERACSASKRMGGVRMLAQCPGKALGKGAGYRKGAKCKGIERETDEKERLGERNFLSL